MIPPDEALERLRRGNHRFASGHADDGRASRGRRRSWPALDHDPVAVVLGCSDARVPVEIVFDQGPGDLFVVRVAGNVATPTQIGSVEFAVERLGARLVVVLGHTGCGAVAATLEALEGGAEPASPHLAAIVDRVRPAVEEALAGDSGEDRDALARTAVRANVRASAARLREDSDVLAGAVAAGELLVVGAEYALERGTVTFFDGVPGSG